MLQILKNEFCVCEIEIRELAEYIVILRSFYYIKGAILFRSCHSSSLCTNSFLVF